MIIASIRKHLPVWLTAVLGLVVTGLLVAFIAVNRNELASQRFDHTANRLTDEIAGRFTDSMRVVYHLSAFYQGSEYVSRQEFNQYVSGFINHYPEIHALEWVPRIPRRQRLEHEQQQSVFKQGYTITEKLQDNTVIPASQRDVYFPVTYLYPIQGNESAFGYDLASNPARKAMLEYAVASNSLAVSRRIRLVQENADSYTVLIALPVMTKGKVSLSIDNRHLQGFVIGVFRINPIMRRVSESFDFRQMNLEVREFADHGDGELLFQYHVTNKSLPVYVFSRVIKVANRDWQVVIKADPMLFGAYTWMDLLILFMSGLGFTALLAAYIQLIRHSQQQANQTSEILLREINQRRQYENKLIESNGILEVLSREDPVMKIANRRAFDEYLLNEWKRAQRSGFPLSLIIADIDNFKAYNDTYGHLVGDHCLRAVAGAFRELANRPADLAARYGGEEIAVIMPETVDDGAAGVAERIRQAVVDLAITHENSITSSVVTISLGVTTIMNVADYSLDEIVKSADAALYTAKQQGKNKVVQIKPGEHKPGNTPQVATPASNISRRSNIKKL